MLLPRRGRALGQVLSQRAERGDQPIAGVLARPELPRWSARTASGRLTLANCELVVRREEIDLVDSSNPATRLAANPLAGHEPEHRLVGTWRPKREERQCVAPRLIGELPAMTRAEDASQQARAHWTADVTPNPVAAATSARRLLINVAGRRVRIE
jgi:hypothetical protein